MLPLAEEIISRKGILDVFARVSLVNRTMCANRCWILTRVSLVNGGLEINRAWQGKPLSMDERRLPGMSVTPSKFQLNIKKRYFECFDKGFPCQQNDVCKSMLGFDKGFPCQWRSENKPRLTRETLVNG